MPHGARRALVTCHGGQSRGLRRGPPARVRHYAQQVADNAARWPRASQSAVGASSPAAPTTTLVLVDVRSFGLTGRQAESALEDRRRHREPQLDPVDPNGAWYTSGVRLGTPALTTWAWTPPTWTTLPTSCAGARQDRADTTSKGEPSKAKFILDDEVCATQRTRAADLLAANPLYPTVGSLDGVSQ